LSTDAALRSTGLADFQSRRKQGSRENLLAAAKEAFCVSGYFAVSVEDIASAAGVSRMTFYRHFSDKSAIAIELFRQNAETAMPRLLAIGERNFRDLLTIEHWIAGLFAADRSSRQLLRVFIQANVDEAHFSETGHNFIENIISGLGQKIPAFAHDRAAPSERRRWLESWLLIYEILDQANHAARDSGVATDPLVTEILAERFLAFVKGAA
jgi:AcrR family transcriptional regulator